MTDLTLFSNPNSNDSGFSSETLVYLAQRSPLWKLMMQNKDAWSERLRTMSFPCSNNGWTYLAYLARLDHRLESASFREHVFSVFNRNRSVMCGYLFRIDSDIPISRDDLSGALYLGWKTKNKIITSFLRETLESKDGIYLHPNDDAKDRNIRDMYRFLGFRAFVLACDDINISLRSQLSWCVPVLWNAIKPKKSESALLETWYQGEVMDRFPLCRFAMIVMQWILRGKGILVKDCLAKEPREVPEMSWQAEQQNEQWVITKRDDS